VTDSRDEVAVMQALSSRLGLDLTPVFEDPWTALERAFDGALENAGWDDLLSGKLLKFVTKPPARYPTPSGKIEFFASQAEALGLNPLPVQAELSQKPEELRLLMSATPHYTSTQFQETYGPLSTTVMMHPDDAGRLNIIDGQTLWLTNENGRMQVTITISDCVLPGMVWAPRQSEDNEKNPQNGLTCSLPQEIGKGPRFNSTRVRVLLNSPIGAPASPVKLVSSQERTPVE
jgi:anaerobic selenocysteine-containing dehydrogenase